MNETSLNIRFDAWKPNKKKLIEKKKKKIPEKFSKFWHS